MSGSRTARSYLRELRAESNAIREALEILTTERPDYGDRRLARDLGVEASRVAAIRRAAGLRWKRGRITPEMAATALPGVLAVLRENGGNVKRTARETGIAENTVRRWKATHFVPEEAP